MYLFSVSSDHNLPVEENILNREFDAAHPKMKMVSDITYIRTDESWLYLAVIMNLCSQKVVDISIDSRMTKDLVSNATNDTIAELEKTPKDILCIQTVTTSIVLTCIKN